MFFSCHFIREVYDAIKRIIGGKGEWMGESM